MVRITKQDRWSQFMTDLTRVGPNEPLGFDSKFAQKWVDIALVAVMEKKPEAGTAAKLYYGFGPNQEPQTRATIKQELRRSSRWTGLTRTEGTALLREELTGLSQLATSSPPADGPLGMLVEELVTMDCVLKTLTSKERNRHLNEEATIVARRNAKQLAKWLAPTLSDMLGRPARAYDLTKFSPGQIKILGKIGEGRARWLEDYLAIFGIVLPGTKSVHGMRDEARKVLESMHVI